MVGTGSPLLTVNFPGLSVEVTTTVGFSTLFLQGAAYALCISCFSCYCKKTSNQSNLKEDDLFWVTFRKHTVRHGGDVTAGGEWGCWPCGNTVRKWGDECWWSAHFRLFTQPRTSAHMGNSAAYSQGISPLLDLPNLITPSQVCPQDCHRDSRFCQVHNHINPHTVCVLLLSFSTIPSRRTPCAHHRDEACEIPPKQDCHRTLGQGEAEPRGSFSLFPSLSMPMLIFSYQVTFCAQI